MKVNDVLRKEEVASASVWLERRRVLCSSVRI